ncbi:hypothetical protein PF003_g29342 [Phytophthora fragariae]|nr:hypothetical protein PF003_g29342 [Phytophthora fragariae]
MRACGFKLQFNDDQSTAWLGKDGLKLRFVCHDMLYRMRVKRSVRLVGAVEQRKNAMGLLTRGNWKFSRMASSQLPRVQSRRVSNGDLDSEWHKNGTLESVD